MYSDVISMNVKSKSRVHGDTHPNKMFQSLPKLWVSNAKVHFLLFFLLSFFCFFGVCGYFFAQNFST